MINVKENKMLIKNRKNGHRDYLWDSIYELRKDITNYVLKCKVKNTGVIEGKEVVQVYVGKKKSKVKRAKKELKGFKKVAVSSNQSIEVNINIDIKELAYYNEKSASWEIEKGNYIIYIGNGSRNISKEIEITIV